MDVKELYHLIVALAGSGSGGGKTTEDIVTNKADGNIPAGTLFPAGTDLTTYIKMRGVSDLAPIVNLTQPSTVLFEIGTTPTITLAGTAQKTDTDITKVELYKGSELIDTITDSLSFSHTFDDITSNVVLKAKAYDATNTGEASKQITFVYPSYYGVEDSLTKVLQTSKGSTRTFTFTNDKAIYKYPKSFGALTSIKDSNNIEYINTFDRTEVVEGGTTYYQYKQQSATTVTNFKFIFA